MKKNLNLTISVAIFGLFAIWQTIFLSTHGKSIVSAQALPVSKAVANYFPSQLITGGTGFFVNSGQSLGQETTLAVALGDVDQDGDQDAVIGHLNLPHEVWLNNGNGFFTDSGQRLGGNLQTEDIVLGDLDGDNDLDAFVANGYGSEYDEIWFNNGTGVFTDSGQTLGPTASKGVDLGDLDNDGDLDAYVGNWNEPDWVYLNDGNGYFTDTGQRLGGSWHGYGVEMGDLDADNDLDVFVTYDQGSLIWLNDGTGILSSGQVLNTIEGGTDAALGDLDTDGDLDAFITYHEQMPDQVWLNNGNAIFSNSEQNLGTFRSENLVLGDLDADGDLDAFVASSWDLINVVWLNNGFGEFIDTGQHLGSYPGWDLELGDLDNDGDLDAFLANTNNSPNEVWFNIDGILPPGNLDSRAGLASILLTWNPSPSTDVVGYHIYREDSNSSFERLTTSPLPFLSYSDTSVVDNETYTYYATAVDSLGQESLPSNYAQATPGSISLTIPDVHTTPGEIAQIPVNIENADGLCIAAMDIGILNDEQIARSISVAKTALTLGYTFSANLNIPGETRISSIGNCSPLVGPGNLFLVDFQVYPTATITSTLDFWDEVTTIYDESNLFDPLPLNLVNGELILDGQYILGDLNGDGVVNSPDALIALHIATGEITPTPQQRLAGDVNGDGIINSADAAMILYYATHGEWPPLPTVQFDLATENNVQLYPGSATGIPGNTVEIPVLVSDASDLAGGTVFVTFGSDLTFLSARLDDAINPNDYQLASHLTLPEEVRLSFAGKSTLPAGQQTLIWVQFLVSFNATETKTWVEVTGAWLNDLIGRDFAISALQRIVTGGEGMVQLTQNNLYIPVVIR